MPRVLWRGAGAGAVISKKFGAGAGVGCGVRADTLKHSPPKKGFI